MAKFLFLQLEMSKENQFVRSNPALLAQRIQLLFHTEFPKPLRKIGKSDAHGNHVQFLIKSRGKIGMFHKSDRLEDLREHP